MKKTDNYSLPQWEKQDFIKMEDFNDLTQKTVAVASAFALSAASVLPKASLKSSILMKSCFSHCGRE